jgi:hypothetical protein
MTTRRDFLRALSLGTGAILVGRGWYQPGRGVIVPPDYNVWPLGLMDIAVSSTVQGLDTITLPSWRVVGDWHAPSIQVEFIR